MLALLAWDGANLIAVLVVAELRGGAYDKRILNVVDSQRGVVAGGGERVREIRVVKGDWTGHCRWR